MTFDEAANLAIAAYNIRCQESAEADNAWQEYGGYMLDQFEKDVQAFAAKVGLSREESLWVFVTTLLDRWELGY